jgi:arylsulfatase A-like enzyme
MIPYELSRRFCRVLAVPAVLFGLTGCRGEKTGGGTAAGLHIPRHIFLITVDTLRADHMSLYGYGRATSPNLQKAAASGVTFDRAICQWPKTGSSFASMFTGLYPHTTGITHKAAVRVPEKYVTLPVLFKESGFTTVGVVSNAVVSSKFGWNRGFNELAETWGSGEFPDDPKLFRPLASAPKVNELAVTLLKKYAKSDRLFAWIHYSDTHAPYMLPAGIQNPFLGDPLFQGDREVPQKVVNKGYTLNGHTDLKYYVAQYDANVLVADTHIQKLLDEMRSLGLLDDSLVIVTADHGEELGEHNSWFEHGPLPYNTTAHVPLVFLMNGLPAGRRVGQPVELVDLYPTLKDLIAPGRKVEGLEGHSLWPLLQGKPGRKTDFGEAFSEAGRQPDLYHSVQDGAWKLVFNSGGKRSKAASSTTGGFELYNLLDDPLETRNLAAEKPEEVRRLRKELAAWMRRARAEGGEEEVNDENERALKALGYAN